MLLERTGGLGADHVLLAAGGDSNGPVEVAARLARDRARVVDIGKTRLDLPWNAYYEKELDVRFSRSYGPGRYDDRYELEGIDYPAGYVRWTERRNLGCFLDLLADGSVDVTPLISGVHPVEEAADVYSQLGAGSLQGIGFLLSYGDPRGFRRRSTRTLSQPSPSKPPSAPVRRPSSAAVRLGFIGAGNYATSMLLPHLRDNSGVELASVATTKSLSGLNAQRKFGFGTMTTDVEAVLDDETLDAVFIVTRHHSHASLVCQALERGLTVFVEKPLALTEEQLAAIVETVEKTGNDRVMVGLQPAVRAAVHRSPGTLRHLGRPGVGALPVNAGRLDAKSWYLNEELEGSRFAGEGGHFIDTLSALVGHHAGRGVRHGRRRERRTPRCASPTGPWPRSPTSPTAAHVSRRRPSTSIGDGRNGRLDNFQRVTVWSAKGKSGHRVLAGQDKGQRAQLDRVRRRGPHRLRDADLAGFPGRDHPRHARRRKQPVGRKAGGLVTRPSPGWYLTRLRGMSATEVAHRSLDAGRRRLWARRQVQPGDGGRPAARHPSRSGPSRRRCRHRPGPTIAPDAASGLIAAADRGAGRDLDRAGRAPDRQRRPRLVRRSGHRAPRAGPASWPSGSTTATRPRPATSSRSGRCPGTTTSPSWRPPGG